MRIPKLGLAAMLMATPGYASEAPTPPPASKAKRLRTSRAAEPAEAAFPV